MMATSSVPSPPSYFQGFTSSICGLFSDPYDRSSCCALVCCGSFLYGRNHYALTGRSPSTLSQWSALVFLALLIAMGLVKSKYQEYIWIAITVFASVFGLERANFRNKILTRLAEERGASEQIESGCCSPRVHRCLSCVPVDDSSSRVTHGDFCFNLWRCVAVSCCGCCCCWCNCCGMCAIGQEHRELKRILPDERFWFDYITYQPYKEYASRIEMLRQSQSTSFYEQWCAISKLSSGLVKFTFASVGCLVLLTGFLEHFGMDNILIILGTFGQATLVLYVTYWRNHCLDISLDAVIKLFASGFFLATTVAFVLEVVIDEMSTLVYAVIMTLKYKRDHPDTDFQDPDDVPTPEDTIEYIEHNMFLLVLFVAFKAFITAGLVEEIAKHFCFWMVEHTDFMTPDLVKSIIRSEDENGNLHAGSSVAIDQMDQPVAPRDLLSRASAIRAGMIATAAGFACCENIMYTLAGDSFKQALEVLILRSVMPLHPIAAAIQSLGVIQRDLGGVGGVGGVGASILPAVFLHGLFDFVVMLPDYLHSAKNPPTEPVEGEEPEPQTVDKKLLLYSTICGFVVMIMGLCYWFAKHRKQEQRLNALEQRTNGTNLEPDANNNGSGDGHMIT